MIVQSAEVYTCDIPLLVPYTIAYETISSTINHFIVITTRGGIAGIGCAAPAPEVTGESAERSLRELNKMAASLVGRSVDTLYSTPDWVNPSAPSATTAVDLALTDILARGQNKSCLEWLKPGHSVFEPVTTSVTIGISSVEETLTRAKQLVKQGFTFLKIKGGHQIQTDMDRLQALRTELGPNVDLALDANQGYSLTDVEHLERHQETIQLSYLEQPTPKSDLKLLGKAASIVSIPVMADEAVQTVEDTKKIGDLGTVRLVNIKLQKMGGLRAASAIDKAARDAGMRTMLGCMDESALSIAAALYFGGAHPNVQYYDLDGHFDLSQDPLDGLVTLRNGQLSAPAGLGLGWSEMPDFR